MIPPGAIFVKTQAGLEGSGAASARFMNDTAVNALGIKAFLLSHRLDELLGAKPG